MAITINSNKITALSKRQILYGLFAFILLIWSAFYIYGHYYVSTENAYVNANVVTVAARVSGEVVKLPVRNNQFVSQGQLLFQIDKVPFQVALNKNQAALASAVATHRQAELKYNRNKKLLEKNAVSQQEVDDAYASLLSAAANETLQKENVNEAQLNLNYTDIYSPIQGQVTELQFRVGNKIQAHQPLFSLIDSSEFWVDANFKETELTHIRAGQTAKITIDMYPNHDFNGVVESVSGGTGAAFSLLPPENATGNWVKITQRIPVRIKILNVDQKHFPLRIGSSANVTVHLN